MKRIIRHNLPSHILDYDTENKQAYYKHFYYKWLFINSDTASFKNESIPKNDRLFYLIGKKITETTNNKNDIEFCGTSAGIKLNEIDFLKFEIEAYNRYLKYCENIEDLSNTNIFDFYIKIKDYLNYLRKRKVIAEKCPSLLNYIPVEKNTEFVISNNKYCKGYCYAEIKDYKELTAKVNNLYLKELELKEQIISTDNKIKSKANNYLYHTYLKDLSKILDSIIYYLADKEDSFFEHESNIIILAEILTFIESHASKCSLHWAFPTIKGFNRHKDSGNFEASLELNKMTESEYLKFILEDRKKAFNPFLELTTKKGFKISLEFLKDYNIYSTLQKRNNDLIKHIEILMHKIDNKEVQLNKKFEKWASIFDKHNLSKLYKENIDNLTCKELHETIDKIGFLVYNKEITNKDFDRPLQQLFEKLYLKSVKENYFWQFCSFETYKKNLDINSHKYFLEHIAEGATNPISYYNYQNIELKNSYDFKKNQLVYRFKSDSKNLNLSFITIETEVSNKIINSLLSKIHEIEKRVKITNEYDINNLMAKKDNSNLKNKPETKEILKTDLSTSIIKELDKYGFSKYLKENSYCITKIKCLIKENQSSTPFTIALLSKLGFISYLSDNHFTTKESLFKHLSIVLKCNQRRVKGNVNVLNKTSNENKVNYTSWQYTENIDLQSLGL